MSVLQQLCDWARYKALLRVRSFTQKLRTEIGAAAAGLMIEHFSFSLIDRSNPEPNSCFGKWQLYFSQSRFPKFGVKILHFLVPTYFTWFLLPQSFHYESVIFEQGLQFYMLLLSLYFSAQLTVQKIIQTKTTRISEIILELEINHGNEEC